MLSAIEEWIEAFDWMAAIERATITEGSFVYINYMQSQPTDTIVTNEKYPIPHVIIQIFYNQFQGSSH
jgi:hypothetical protein